MTSEWEHDATEMARYLEEGENLQDYPEEYYREFDLLYVQEAQKNQAIQEATQTSDECPW